MLLKNCRLYLLALALCQFGAVDCLLKDVALSHPTVLLPFHLPETPINFTISLSSGCAKWSSSRPNAVKIVTTDDDAASCSTSAALSAVLKEPGRIFSVVQADVKNGRPPLVSDVEVNLIKTVSIVTTTKILYIGFPFTVFSIHAFDENGNLFTNIEGIPFLWTVLPDSKSEYPEHTGKYVLRILKWSDVSNEPPKAISALEQKGERGSSVVISGLKIGVAFIEAKISSPVYPDVDASRVRVIVKDFLIMKPSGFVSIMVQQILEIETFNMNYNKQSKLQLPTDTYWLALNKKGSDHLKLHGGISSVEGLSLGETAVCIASTIPDDDTGPCLDVLVTEPDYGIFSSDPDHDWLLELGHQYAVQALFYDKNDNLIYPKTLFASSKYENEFVRVDMMADNQTYFLVTPLKVGQSSFSSQLQSVIGLNNKKIALAEKFKVSKTQQFKIIEPVEVSPKVLGFIWMPDTTNSYFYQLEAVGGSGSYRWESENVRVASVSKQGMLETTGTPGDTIITVTDRQMPRHFDLAKVHVGSPGKIVVAPFYVESQVNSDLMVPVRVFIKRDSVGKDKEKDTDDLIEAMDCVDLPLKISFSNPQIFQFLSVVPKTEDEPYNYGCGLIWLNTTGAGFTQMTISLLDIESVVTLAGFSELKLKDLDDTIVLSLGASVPITTVGGLLPWELDPSKFYRNTKVSDLKVIKQLPNAENLKWIEKSVFVLACSELGESTFSVVTSNYPTAHNKNPKSASVKITVRCASPSSVKLVPEPFIPDCPPYLNMHSEPLPILVGEPQVFQVVAKDSTGMTFANFSSLGNTISGCKSVSIKQDLFPKIAVTFANVNDCQIELTISGYRKMYTFRDIYESVSVVVSLSGKESPKLGSNTVSIFNHPSNAKNIPVKDGSGYFNLVVTSASPISDLSVDQKNSWIAIKPIKDGREILSISDMCFPKLPSMQLEIVVSSIGTILVRSKRIMQLNSSDILEVQVMDSNGWNIESKMFDVINLQLVTNNDKVSFTPMTSDVGEEKSKFSRFYKTVARNVGTLQLHFTAKLTSGVISSLQHDIQVFNPLIVDPSVVYMLIGQFYQIQTSGGPQPLPSLHYQLDATNVGKIHSSGLFEATEIGSCLVHVNIIDSNDLDVLSKTTVEFHVVELTSIEINVALPSFPTEAIIPAYVTGNGGKITPLTANLNVNYDWSVSNTDVIKLLHQHEYSGVQQGPAGNFALRLLALTNGRATISVTVTQPTSTPKTKSIFPRNAAQSLTAQATVFVYDRLALIQPKLCCRNTVLMTTKSSIFVKSNVNFVNYRIMYQTNPKLVSIDYRGQLSSGDVEGQSVLTVECTEDNGINQTMTITVEVKTVNFIRLQTSPVFPSDSNALQGSTWTSLIPQGVPVTLKASLHDDQGNEFDANDASLKVKLNRYDIGQVSLDNNNNTFMFRNSAPGISAIGVLMKGSKGMLSDYVALPVGDVLISPQPDQITVGTVFCLQSPFGEQGSWSSSSSEVLKIDSQSGVAIVLGSGPVEVTYGFQNSKLRTFKKLLVNSVHRLELTPNQNSIVYPSENVNFKFSIGSKILCSEEVFGASKAYNFDLSWLKCSAWFESHVAHLNTQLTIKPTFSSQDGFLCELEILSTKPEHIQSLAGVLGNVNVQATILPSQSRRAVSSNTIQQQFVPKFYVATKSVILSNQYPSVEILVEANEKVAKDLQITSKSHSLLTVTKLVKDSTVKISLDLLPNVFAQVSETVNTEIEVTCGISTYSQTITVIIQRSKFATSDKLAKGSETGDLFSFIYFYVPIILTAVCLLFGYYITLLYKQQNKLIDISVSEAAMSHSPYRTGRLNDTTFGGGDALGFIDRTGPPGATPFPHLVRKNIGINRSLNNTLEDSMSVTASPWPSSRTSPGRVQLWSQTSLSPADAGRGS